MTLDVPVLLLTGRSSRPLEEEAFRLAAITLCRTGEQGPGCRDCRRVESREHPDLLAAAPERRRRVNCPPFEEVGESRETTIPAALVRAVAAHASLLPYEAPRRAVLLLDVDRTDGAAFSALLKVLEEPPLHTRFILTATRSRVLPPTILSRTVVLTLPTPSRREVADRLCRSGVPVEQAEARAAFGGDADEARTLDLAASRAARDGLLEALSGVVLTGSVGWALALAHRLTAEDATQSAGRLTLLAQLLRDATAAAVDPTGHSLVHRERYADLARLGAAPAGSLLEIAGKAIRLGSELVESRRNVRLACEGFALGLLPEVTLLEDGVTSGGRSSAPRAGRP